MCVSECECVRGRAVSYAILLSLTVPSTMKFIDKRTCWLLTTSSHTIARRGACTTHTHTKQKGHGLTQKGHKQCACLFGCGATQLNNKGREEKGKRRACARVCECSRFDGGENEHKHADLGSRTPFGGKPVLWMRRSSSVLANSRCSFWSLKIKKYTGWSTVAMHQEATKKNSSKQPTCTRA